MVVCPFKDCTPCTYLVGDQRICWSPYQPNITMLHDLHCAFDHSVQHDRRLTHHFPPECDQCAPLFRRVADDDGWADLAGESRVSHDLHWDRNSSLWKWMFDRTSHMNSQVILKSSTQILTESYLKLSDLICTSAISKYYLEVLKVLVSVNSSDPVINTYPIDNNVIMFC